MENIKPLKKTDYSVHQLIANRWSGRSFDSRAVEDEKLFSLLEAARWASSSMNEQPWHFIVTKKGNKAFDDLFSTLMPGNQLWADKAPILILTVVKTVFSANGRDNYYAEHDLGLAVGNFSLQATHLELNLHQMGGFDREKAKELFQLPENYRPVSVIALGYLGKPDTLPEKYQQSEVAPQNRRSIQDFTFNGKWNNPITNN